MDHSHNPPDHAKCGYTLTELLITIALLALLLQTATPPLTRLLAAWQRDQVTRTLIDHLALARSAAVHGSRKVVVCSSVDGRSCAPASIREWTSGWLVFQDLDDDNQFGANDKLIALSQGAHGIRSVQGSANVQRFVFLPTGMLAYGMSTLEIVPRIGETQKIIVNRIGRVRLSRAEPEDGR